MTKDRDVVREIGAVGEAFFGGFWKLREVQRRGIPPILEGKNVLVVSATASGKTEAIVAPLVARTRSRERPGARRIRMLLIAPTRALVNDLASRIESPLDRLDITCGRQTGDHGDKSRSPFVLVTTPESLDSMLVRDVRLERGRIVDHLLAGVSAVFVDEAHLLDGTTRGDQLCWLLGRLDRLRGYGRGKLHVCAGSATVTAPEGLAGRLLGAEAVVVRVPGTRDIEVFGTSGASSWFRLEPFLGITDVRAKLALSPSVDFNEIAERRIWHALSKDADAIRKVLVFVPTRKLADILSAHLSDALRKRRELRVVAHHGSLSTEFREHAERTFATSRDAVMVATTTLEVGIDIGDVDLVVLVGAPPGTRSLLQRIGRGGRRIGVTRVLALPRTLVEQAALASMLVSARDGTLEEEAHGRRWSVFVQQVASFVAQSKPRGRRRSDLDALVRAVWGDESVGTSEAIIDALLEDGYLVENRQRLTLGEPWADTFDGLSSGMHANFTSGGGIPVVNGSTGEIVARVSRMPAEEKGLALGGQRWDVQDAGHNELLLMPRDTGAVAGGFEYATRSGPTSVEYAVHVRRGCGLKEIDAPVLELSDRVIWLHFGGSAYQMMLCALVPGLRPVGTLSGLAVAGRPSDGGLRAFASQGSALNDTIDSRFEDLERGLSVGPYQGYLPDGCRRGVVADLLDVPTFTQWLQTRRIWTLTSSDPLWNQIEATFSASLRAEE